MYGIRACLVLLTVLAAGVIRADLRQLPIPPRQQWDNNRGYCGECTIQEAALYFGAYFSQARIRELIDPTQRQDLWLPEHADRVFPALRLSVAVWNSGKPAPQYQSFLIWMKKHLRKGHPVAFDVYSQYGVDPYYDHIVLATGVESDDLAWHSSDRLIFNDHYQPYTFTRYFGSLPDNRSMSGNGAFYKYCIPRRINGGVAIRGIVDQSGTARRVVVSLNRWSEPNVTLGQAPVLLRAAVTAHGLTPGKRYALLRYDDVNRVPVNGYLSSPYATRVDFTATGSSQAFEDRFRSDGVAVYRCVPAG